jgi:hypothetical protein
MNNDDTTVYAEVDSIRKLARFMRGFYKHLCDVPRDTEISCYYASFMCRIAVGLRAQFGIDLCTLTFPVEPSPLPPSHPLSKVLPILEGAIKAHFDHLEAKSAAGAPTRDTAKLLPIHAMMQAAFIWKSYLLSLNTHPIYWESDSVFGLSCFQLLTTPDPADVVKMTIEISDEIEIKSAIRAMDWPPRHFIKFYSKNKDLLELKLRQIIPLPEEESEIDVVKMIARRNTMRRDHELNRAPRASGPEIAARAAGLRSLDAVMKAYQEMNRHDFCDAVAIAAKSVNLSQDNASMAMSLREWVLSDGDRRMPFPEWLASEGRQHISSLNREWVGSALREKINRNMSFHEWLTRPNR